MYHHNARLTVWARGEAVRSISTGRRCMVNFARSNRPAIHRFLGAAARSPYRDIYYLATTGAKVLHVNRMGRPGAAS